MWAVSNRADQAARVIADRHYNRQSVGSAQFVPPGRCFVLLTDDQSAVWVTSWPFAEYVKHQWAGAMVNSLFRNEGSYLSSELIKEAVERTIDHWKGLPELGIVSFVDSHKVAPKRYPGWCYRKAGWKHVGYTKGGLYTYQFGATTLLSNPTLSRRDSMATNTADQTTQTTTDNGTEAKQRTRINPRIKMVRALHSILGEQLRNNLTEPALDTINEMKRYMEDIAHGS